MQSISDLLKKYKGNIPSEKVLYPRQEIIKMFVDRLNSERGSDFKPLSPAFVASKMYTAGLKTNWDLWWFWGYCKEAKNFSKIWWWSLKG